VLQDVTPLSRPPVGADGVGLLCHSFALLRKCFLPTNFVTHAVSKRMLLSSLFCSSISPPSYIRMFPITSFLQLFPVFRQSGRVFIVPHACKLFSYVFLFLLFCVFLVSLSLKERQHNCVQTETDVRSSFDGVRLKLIRRSCYRLTRVAR
jgi:hypothetical protein